MGSAELTKKILHRYHSIDRRIRLFQLRTGLRCPSRCWVCCQGSQVEATIVECLPLAWEIFRRRQAEPIALIIEEKEREGDFRCVLFAADEKDVGFGRCSYYAHRPLLCRLFGYAARRDKTGRPELRLCKVMREASQNPIFLTILTRHGTNPPVYHDCFLQISSLNPAMGVTLFPINTALKKALDYVYWQCPEGRFPRRQKAA